jgi:hypothetical protein
VNVIDVRKRCNNVLLALPLTMMLAPNPAASAQDTRPQTLPPGWVPPPSRGLVAEPELLRKVANASDGSLTGGAEPRDGLYVELGGMVTGAGWISAGPGYRHHVLGGRALVDVSAAVSWNEYKTAQARFELPHVAHDRIVIGAQAAYQDLVQVDYFGLGDDSLQSDRTAYRFNNLDILGYATVRTTTWLSVSGRAGRITRPDLSTPIGRNVTVPNTTEFFSEASAPGIRTQPPFLHVDVTVAADWRDYPGHPSQGGLYRATMAAYSDRDGGSFSFRRYEVEASQFVPLFTRKWIVALHGWQVFSDASDGSLVPFYLMPSLGGQNTLRGYEDYRFHDNDMQTFNAESRWALLAHVDAVAFIDAGKVAPRAGDLDFKHLKRSYGAGFRVHNSTATLARLDVGHSVEGWRVFFKLSDPFKRSTPAYGRASAVPFVP